MLALAVSACGAAAPTAPTSLSQSYQSCLAAHGVTPKRAQASSSPAAGPAAQRKAARTACRALKPGRKLQEYRSCLVAHGLAPKVTRTGVPSPRATPDASQAKAARTACKSFRPRPAASATP